MSNETNYLSNDRFDPDINLHSSIPCAYYSVDDFNNEFSYLEDKFIVVHQNIRSFNANMDELILYLNTISANVDVIILSETWFCVDSVKQIDGYVGYHSCRVDRRGGGVSVFVNNQLKSRLIPDRTFVKPIAEFCSVNVALSTRQSVNVVGFYRPPNQGSVPQFCDLLEERFLSSFSASQGMMFGGDANIDLLESCLLYTSPSPRDKRQSRMPSSA